MNTNRRRTDWTTRLLLATSIATTLLVAHSAYSDSGGSAAPVAATASGSASTASSAAPTGSGSASGDGSGSGSDKAPTTATATTTMPTAPGFGDIASAFGAGEYALATSLLIILLVGGARSIGLWKSSKLGGWLLNFLGSFGAVLGTAALAHVHITLAVLGGTVVTALSTAGLLELGRDVVDWWKARTAKPSA